MIGMGKVGINKKLKKVKVVYYMKVSMDLYMNGFLKMENLLTYFMKMEYLLMK